jgi:maleate cis-trans isomerase
MSKTDIRVGVLVPVGNTINEAEFNRLKPEGVAFRFAGFANPKNVEGDYCAALTAGMAAPMKDLADWGAKVIFIGCTTASMKCGDPASAARLESIAGVPVITAASAVLDAFRHMNLRTLSVATPYSAAGNKVVADFLSQQGIRVAGIAGLEYDKTPELWRAKAPTLTPEQMLDFSLKIAPDADALYLPCTGAGKLVEIWN